MAAILDFKMAATVNGARFAPTGKAAAFLPKTTNYPKVPPKLEMAALLLIIQIWILAFRFGGTFLYRLPSILSVIGYFREIYKVISSD
jgi:hypothetical protein